MKSRRVCPKKINLSIFTLLVALSFANQLHAGGNADEVVIDHEVIIKDYKFIPETIAVKVGDTIRWKNEEKRQYHSVWFEQAGDPEPEYFFPDESYDRSFDVAGKYTYRCGPHPEMTGTVIVLP